MGTALRVVALFTVYAGIAFAGDSAFDLFARDVARAGEAEADARFVRVEVRPEIVSRIQVGSSGRCDFAIDRELTVPAADLARLSIRVGAGELRIEGSEELEEIVAVGRACASREDDLDALTLTARAGGDGVLIVETGHPGSDGSRSGTARIDLVVLLPAGMAVDVEDSSGSMTVENTGPLRIDDSSGSIRVSNVAGPLRIDDSSGSIRIDGIAGDVSVDDGSGSIRIRGVAGGVELRDGSGSMEISEVASSVVVERDGSGSIRVSDVAGDFRVMRDGSGGIRHSGVRGTVDVPRRDGR